MLLGTLLSLPCLFAQASSKGYLSVGEVPKVVGQRNATVDAVIPITVQEGFHVNSNKPSEEYLIPLKLTWSGTGALQPETLVFPKPSLEKYEFAEKPLSVFTGKFDLVAKFKVAPKAEAGPGAVSGKLRYQACNNRACFAPRTVDVNIYYEIH